ncbi:hypothetical protein ACR3K2_05460 [Cryptosporidium serpentis]
MSKLSEFIENIYLDSLKKLDDLEYPKITTEVTFFDVALETLHRNKREENIKNKKDAIIKQLKTFKEHQIKCKILNKERKSLKINVMKRIIQGSLKFKLSI